MPTVFDRLYPKEPFKPGKATEIVRKLARIYGEYLLARILKCKVGMIRRALNGRPIFTSKQISIINFLLLIEEQIAEKSAVQTEKTRRRKTA